MTNEFPSKEEVQKQLQKLIEEKPNIATWSEEERKLLAYDDFYNNWLPPLIDLTSITAIFILMLMIIAILKLALTEFPELFIVIFWGYVIKKFICDKFDYQRK